MPHQETYIDGVWYPSVTTVLGAQPKPWLTAWRDRLGIRAEYKTAAANNVGSAFHLHAEALVREKTPPAVTRRLYMMLEQFEAWRIREKFVPVHTELKVISRQYQYSGTLDAVGYTSAYGKELVLFDWKTSSRIYPEMGLQLVAYAQAYKETMGKAIKRGVIVHVSKDKPEHKLTTKEFPLGKRLLNKFLKLRERFDGVKVAE